MDHKYKNFSKLTKSILLLNINKKLIKRCIMYKTNLLDYSYIYQKILFYNLLQILFINTYKN